MIASDGQMTASDGRMTAREGIQLLWRVCGYWLLAQQRYCLCLPIMVLQLSNVMLWQFFSSCCWPAGHYKYPPAEIPALLIQSGANLEAKDSSGKTALQVALLSGWQNIAELLIKNGAQTGAVPDIKASITCPDCKRIVATYNL